MTGNPLKFSIERGEGDPFVGLTVSDAGIDLLIYGMAGHHFDVLHPLLGTLSEAMSVEGLSDYVRFEPKAASLTDEEVGRLCETLAIPVVWMKEHVEDRLDYIRLEDGQTRVSVALPEFYWLMIAVELMVPLFEPKSIQYDFLSRMVDKGETVFTDAELLAAGWANGESTFEGGAIQ